MRTIAHDLALLAASAGLMAAAVAGTLAAVNSSNSALERHACLESAQLDHRPASDCR